ncbi:histidine phosphatase family protein [Pelomonas cellulosilytica]|uniref:histidine phosphatase family protein n=1 Tax=Pelomonas cellulosilytica TaxID=2906762 RepID=UPI003B02BDF6
MPCSIAGTTVEQRREWVEAYWQRADPDHSDGPGAESFRNFVGRVDACLERLSTGQSSVVKLTLIFGHGQFINAMRWRLACSRDPSDMHGFRTFDSRYRLGNCDVVKLGEL